MATKKYLIANWKMNPTSIKEAKNLFSYLRGKTKSNRKVEVIICPPLVYLNELLRLHPSKNIKFGAQDSFFEDQGSFTGEDSPKSIKDLGADYVILGHSERRALGETDKEVRAKVEKALQNKLKPIVCIGEKERDDDGTYLMFLKKQIEESLKSFTPKELRDIVIAYEPIWAIGKTDKEAVSPRDLEQTILYIKKVLKEIFEDKSVLKTKIIYGGSVEKENVEGFMKETSADGFLVGHASLDKKEFLEIYLQMK